MAFYDIDTFSAEDYPKTNKDKIAKLVGMMNDYARLALNSSECKTGDAGYESDYKKYYEDKYKKKCKSPDDVMHKISEFVINNKDMTEPCLSMFDRFQCITSYSCFSSVNEMLNAMGNVGEAHPEYASECKLRVIKYSQKFFDTVGHMPEHFADTQALLSTRQFVRDKLDVNRSVNDVQGVRVSKPNRFIRLAKLKMKGKI